MLKNLIHRASAGRLFRSSTARSSKGASHSPKRGSSIGPVKETAAHSGTEPASIGRVEVRHVELDSLTFAAGGAIAPLAIAYEMYGELNADRSNAILCCHALSGDAHAAGFHEGSTAPGWWDAYIGPGKAFSTDKYCIICSNVVGGCKGTSGPSSINPATGAPYGLEFPIITIQDMVNAQAKLLESLGIERLLCVAGGSMGGMQALEWSIRYPERVQSCICIASTSKHSPMQIAFNEVGRQSIMADPNWNDGGYYARQSPAAGLSVARMIGHITYMSEEGLQEKFARRLQNKKEFDFHFDTEFAVESYLRYQGEKFVDRFDANSYLYITRALDYFDLAQGRGSLESAFSQGACRYLFISFSSDWLYPPAGMKELTRAAKVAGREAAYLEIDAPHGHDSFLLPNDIQTFAIKSFLSSERERLHNGR